MFVAITSSTSLENTVSEQCVQAVGGFTIALGTGFTVASFAIRFIKRRSHLWEDSATVFAWVCMVAVCGAYLAAVPSTSRIIAVARGDREEYSTIDDDIGASRRLYFVAALLFWSCLWGVKSSLLVYCKRTIDPRRGYEKAWWCVMCFSILAYVGCLISQFTQCGATHEWFARSGCQSEADLRGQTTSLYFAYSMDILTNILITVFPLPCLMRSRLETRGNLGLIAVFCVAAIYVVVSTIRVAQIGGPLEAAKKPSASWLAMWSMLESAVALVLGCLPTFALLFPPSKPSEDQVSTFRATKTSLKRCQSVTCGHDLDEENARTSIYTGNFPANGLNSDGQNHDSKIAASGSHERLAWCSPGVMVTRTFGVDKPTPCGTSPPNTIAQPEEVRDVI